MQRAHIHAAAAATDTVLVAAVAGKRIAVIAIEVSSDGVSNFRLTDGLDATAGSRLVDIYLTAGQPFVKNWQAGVLRDGSGIPIDGANALRWSATGAGIISAVVWYVQL